MSFQTRKQSSVPQTKANYPRIRHKPNNAKSAAFCSFCVFAGKNAVYLANQSCKDGESKALCHKPKQTIQEFGTSRILKFCAFAKKNAVSLTNQGCKGCQNEALCHTFSFYSHTNHRTHRGPTPQTTKKAASDHGIPP